MSRILGVAEMEKRQGVVELPAKIPGLGRSPIPMGCGGKIDPSAPSFFVATGEQVHGPSMALFCGSSVIVNGHPTVFEDAAPVEKHVRIVVLAPVMMPVCGPTIPLRRGIQIGFASPSRFQTAANHVLGVRVMRLGRLVEPGQRRRLVLVCACPLEKHTTQSNLGRGDAVCSRNLDPLRGLVRIAGKQFRQFRRRHLEEAGHAPAPQLCPFGFGRQLRTGLAQSSPHSRNRLW